MKLFNVWCLTFLLCLSPLIFCQENIDIKSFNLQTKIPVGEITILETIQQPDGLEFVVENLTSDSVELIFKFYDANYTETLFVMQIAPTSIQKSKASGLNIKNFKRILMDRDVTNCSNETDIISYAQSGNLNGVKCSLKNGVKIETQGGEYYWSALMYASYENRLDIVKYLVLKGANVNAKSPYGWTAIMGAAERNHLDVVKYLIQNKADVNAKKDGGWTPLMAAAYHSHYDMAKLLIESGADVNAKRDDGSTPLSWVFYQRKDSYENQIKVAKLLIENGADINVVDHDGLPILSQPLGRGVVDFVRYLVEKDVVVDVKSNTNRLFYCLFYTCSGGAKDDKVALALIKILIESKKLDVNAKDNNGNTALMESHSNLDVVKYLIEKGADINAKSDGGVTALIYAISNLDTVKYLIEKGADINAKDNAGWTALIYASHYSDKLGSVKLLVEAGAKLEMKNNNGETALIVASKGNYKDAVKYLYQSGANPRVRDNNNKTSCDLTTNAEIKQILNNCQ